MATIKKTTTAGKPNITAKRSSTVVAKKPIVNKPVAMNEAQRDSARQVNTVIKNNAKIDSIYNSANLFTNKGREKARVAAKPYADSNEKLTNTLRGLSSRNYASEGKVYVDKFKNKKHKDVEESNYYDTHSAGLLHNEPRGVQPKTLLSTKEEAAKNAAMKKLSAKYKK